MRCAIVEIIHKNRFNCINVEKMCAFIKADFGNGKNILRNYTITIILGKNNL